MPEIDLGLVGAGGAEPDLLRSGPEPGGERRARTGPLWWLPERWRRPPPRSLVAAGSAVLAAAAVALLLDRPAEQPAPEPARLLSPESWLDVQEGGYPEPVEVTAHPQRVAEAFSRHPPAAVLVVPLGDHRPRLIGLPPGSYRVLASCGLTEAPEGLPEPVRVTVMVREPDDHQAVAPELTCDGTPQPVYERLVVHGYQAFFGEQYFYFEEAELGGRDPFAAIQRAEPLILVSFTPAG